MTTTTPPRVAVHVGWVTPFLVAAEVRDDAGEHTVRWAWRRGWSCSCPAGSSCSGIDAVQAVAPRPL